MNDPDVQIHERKLDWHDKVQKAENGTLCRLRIVRLSECERVGLFFCLPLAFLVGLCYTRDKGES